MEFYARLCPNFALAVLLTTQAAKNLITYSLTDLPLSKTLIMLLRLKMYFLCISYKLAAILLYYC